MNKINIANPIYDSVFKYLVEDERIARTLISALLKKEVARVETRPHEYTNITKNAIAMFRIDFSAYVLDDDGNENLVLIELQKTGVETETLRFRQYLGAQYGNACNMLDNGKYGIPMVAVYLMGHRIGDIEEPVLYTSHSSYDYSGRPVTKGLPDPFVDSLTHDSIIVQIPLLRGQVNNRLEKVLSVFDQTKADKRDKKLLLIDEDEYAGDEDMQRIVHRLTAAAANTDMRHEMNVEDEYYSVIEKRETLIMEKDKALEKNKKALEENKKALEEKDARIRTMVHGMLSAGMDIETIAKVAGMTVEEVRNVPKS